MSVVLLTRDEEQRVGRCLDSVVLQGFDRIVVLDTGSRDGTRDIVRRYQRQGVHLHTTTWRESFAAARNEALELIPDGWVVFLDADEWLPDGEPRRLLDRLAFLDGQERRAHHAYAPRITEIGSQMSFEDIPRVFPRESGISYLGRVHEYPVLGAGPYRAPGLAGIDVTFLHDGYGQSVVEARDKPARNLDLLARERAESPNLPRWLFFELREGLFQWDADTLDELCARLAHAEDEGSGDRHGRDHYRRQGLIYACQRLAMLQEWQRVRRNCDTLDALDGSVGPDSHYYRRSLRLLVGDVVREDLLHTIALRRDEAWISRGGLDGTGRPVDALITGMLTALGEHDKATRYRAACAPWSDVFFDRSVLRASARTAP